MILRLCEFAATNRDGTYTIVRGGIEFLEAKQLPAPVDLWLLTECESRTLPKGDLPLAVTATVGEDVLRRMDGLARVASSDPVIRFAIPLQFVATSYGHIVIRCQIGEQAAQLDFEIRQEKG